MNRRSLPTLLPVTALICGSFGLIEYVSTRDAHAATAGNAPTIHCSIPGPCADVRNAGTGIAINAAAANNTGVRAATSAANAPYATVNGVSFGLTGAIVGNDLAASPSTDFNSGVLGFSNNAVGMQGVTFNACNCGSGTDVTTFASNPAVFGLDAGPNNGLAGAGNAGVVGRSLTRVGGLFLTRSGYAAVGRTFTGTGVLGVSRGVGGVALAATSLLGGPIFRGFNGTREVASIDSHGNLTIAGALRTGETPTFAAQAAKGGSVTTYGARQSIATVEDFGRAALRSGSARIRLDPAFADLIDPNMAYMVFITPEGDNRGLYVGERTSAGFNVRESQGGHNTLTFNYRIVAHAFGSHEARFAAVPNSAVPVHSALAMPASGSSAAAHYVTE